MSSDASQYDDVRQGDGDLVTFYDVNKPDPPFEIHEVHTTDIDYVVDWDEREEPPPRDFQRLSILEVRLVTMLADYEDQAIQAAGDEAHQALVTLREAMLDRRDLDEAQRQDLKLGHIDALPEVTRR